MTRDVLGTPFVGIVQGAVGGTLFAVVGIEAAVFSGVVMAPLSLVPAIGAALVGAPAVVILSRRLGHVGGGTRRALDGLKKECAALESSA